MTIKELGKTGILCPTLIYGTSFLGNLYRELSPDEKMAIIKEWFNVVKGTVMIDTAGKYGAGLALEVIGRGLKELGIKPENITISNKLGWYRVPLETDEPTFEPGVWANLKYDAVQKISYQGILECWEQGYKLLGEEYSPEVVSVHDPDEYLEKAKDKANRKKHFNDILEAYKALFELKTEGKVKAVGIGAKDWKVIRELYEYIDFDWVMLANSFTIYHHPREVIDFMSHLRKNEVGIINSAIFNAGFLTGGDYFNYRKISPDNPEDKPLFEWREKFFEVCDEFNVEPGDACLKFAVSAPQIQAVALNPSKPKRMISNKKVLQTQFSAEFWRKLREQGILSKDYLYL